MYSRATPRLLSTCSTGCYECKEKFVYRFLYQLRLLEAVYSSRVRYCVLTCVTCSFFCKSRKFFFHKQRQEQELDKIKDKNKTKSVQLQEKMQDKNKTRHKSKQKQDIEEQKSRPYSGIDVSFLCYVYALN